jgi:hypothetical protein
VICERSRMVLGAVWDRSGRALAVIRVCSMSDLRAVSKGFERVLW